jgi:aspartyl/glutamyl-tRNA(asn/gln) amidotransferase subunit B
LDHFHIEEDPAKLTHTKTGTLIDYNRSGKPLLEIVTQPDIYSISDALSYMNALHKLVRALKISDGDMEK